MSFNPRKRQRTPDPKDYPFVFFGTPLPPLDPEVRDDGTYVPLWKQEVRDERGRKRLHGAFTGGFSAGYFNTVGSKEGWTPATFTSSRTNRAKSAGQTVEDFMDDEDLAEMAESQQISTKSQFEGLGSTANELQKRGAADLFDDLLRPKEDTIGIKLLRKMGWREGQGVGPRVQRKLVDEEDMDDGEGPTYSLAPINSAIIALERKTNVQGLGYTAQPGLERRVEKAVKKVSSTSTSATGMRGSMGFGVLNDDEDEDPYDVGLSKDHYSTTVVPKRDRQEKHVLKPPSKHTFTFKPKGSTTATETAPVNRRGHDGRLPLPGFTLSDSPFTLSDEWFAPPVIPEDYSPLPPTLGVPVLGLSTHRLAPRDRGALLGEKPLPGKSVFSFLTPEARAQISQATGRSDLPPALNESGPTTSKPRGTAVGRTNIPSVSKDTAVAALNGGFMPYGDNPEKQKRYRAYLEAQAELSEKPIIKAPSPSSQLSANLQPPSLTAEEWNKELSEFVRAAQVFRPMSRLMASRFTSSSTTVLPGSDGSATTAKLTVPAPKTEDPAVEAAKMNMYGRLTRTITDFYPTRLLCKRFNVKDPHPVPTEEDEKKEVVDTTLINAEKVQELRREARAVNLGTYDLAPVESSEPAEIQPDRNEVLEGERAGEEVFKSIFGDESDDE